MCVHITLNMTGHTVKKKDKAISMQTSTDLESCISLRLPDLKTIDT
jgi:hypothetical protein